MTRQKPWFFLLLFGSVPFITVKTLLAPQYHGHEENTLGFKRRLVDVEVEAHTHACHATRLFVVG